MGDDPTTWTVMLVDDDEDNLNVLQQYLDFLGVKWCSARDGLEALNNLIDQNVTIVLLDLSMPTLDGWEMIRRLRTNERLAHLPVIAVTAHAMAGDKERALQSGFNGYIAKPFMFNDVLQEMKRCVEFSVEVPGKVETQANSEKAAPHEAK